MTLAWCFPDEASPYAEDVLVALEGWTIRVPAIWALEVANAVLVGERTGRLAAPEIRRFTVLLENLPFVQDALAIGACLRNVVPLAHKQGLSAYDAAYLELAIRHDTPLATLDGRLARAAQWAGIPVFPSESA